MSKYQLRGLVWEITMQCNMRCIHCGTAATLEKRQNELNTKEALDLIRQIAGLGAKKITLSGGEPFIRKDWPILAREVLKNKMICGLISNGFLLDEKVARQLFQLEKLGTIFVAISIDGMEKTHNHIRQNPGSFRRIQEVLTMLARENFPTAIITQVNKLNFPELSLIQEFIFKFPNIYAWQVQVATPWGRMKEAKELAISTEEYVQLAKFLAEQIEIWGKRVVAADDIGYYTEYEKIFRPPDYPWSGCYAGICGLGIRSNGDITGCLSLMEDKYIEGNIRKQKLKDIWEDDNKFIYNRQFSPAMLEGNCKDCRYGLRCRGGCKNIAISFCGSPFANRYCLYNLLEKDKK